MPRPPGVSRRSSVSALPAHASRASRTWGAPWPGRVRLRSFERRPAGARPRSILPEPRPCSDHRLRCSSRLLREVPTRSHFSSVDEIPHRGLTCVPTIIDRHWVAQLGSVRPHLLPVRRLQIPYTGSQAGVAWRVPFSPRRFLGSDPEATSADGRSAPPSSLGTMSQTDPLLPACTPSFKLDFPRASSQRTT